MSDIMKQIPSLENKKWKLEIWQSGKITCDLWLSPDCSDMEILQLEDRPQRQISTNGNWGRKEVERRTKKSLLMRGRPSGIQGNALAKGWQNYLKLLISAERELSISLRIGQSFRLRGIETSSIKGDSPAYLGKKGVGPFLTSWAVKW